MLMFTGEYAFAARRPVHKALDVPQAAGNTRWQCKADVASPSIGEGQDARTDVRGISAFPLGCKAYQSLVVSTASNGDRYMVQLEKLTIS